jgi:hypothetical protein
MPGGLTPFVYDVESPKTPAETERSPSGERIEQAQGRAEASPSNARFEAGHIL